MCPGYRARYSQLFTEDFVADKGITVTIDGGYACDYSANPDKTTLQGAPHVSNGVVTMKNFRIAADVGTNAFNISADSGIKGTLSQTSADVYTNGSQTVTITPPSSRYAILDVKVDGVSQGPLSSYTFNNVSTAHSLKARFTLLYCSNPPARIAGPTPVYFNTLQAAYNAASDGATIQAQGQLFTEDFIAGKGITVTIDGGYTCDYLANPDKTVLQGAPQLSTGTVTMKNFRIASDFGTNAYNITATAGNNGTISTDLANINYGGSQTFTLTAIPGYHVADFLVNGVSQGAPPGSVSSYTYTIANITAPFNISASFAINSYTITTTAGSNGSISPATSTVNHGSSKTFTIKPDIGHSVIVPVGGDCGGSYTGNPSDTVNGITYTTNAITANCTVSPGFSLNTYTVTPSVNAGAGIAAGGYHTVALKSDGTVWAWGWNNFGQLGSGTTTILQAKPGQVNGLTGVTAIAAGYDHSMALKADGTVWVWGNNDSGQLGNGATTNSFTPVQVSGLTGVTAIAAGHDHSVALKGDGTVWTWGGNSYGQLGNGTTTNSFTPVQVNGLTGVTAIAAGGYHTVALKVYGTAWAWGNNDSGQLGDGTTTSKSAPFQVSGLTGVMTIAAGGYHTVVRKGNGTTWAWGNNNSGQLGNGTTTNSFTPVQVSGLTGVTAIAAGYEHTVAIKDSDTAWAWGYNGSGELGDGTYMNRSTPFQVSGLSDVTTIAAGGYHTVALKRDGTAWTWGHNGYGELGDGDTMNRSIPESISELAITNGSISPATPRTVYYNSTISFTVTPATGYSIASVTGCGGTLSGATYTTGPITGNCTVTAAFRVSTFTVTPSAGANGSISPNTPQTVNRNADSLFIITPATGYQVADVIVDGVSLGVVSRYSFSNIAADHTISATFAINTYPIAVNQGIGTITPATATVNHGGSQTFTISHTGRYLVVDVKVDGVSHGNISSYTFNNVTGPHSIEAAFSMSPCSNPPARISGTELYFTSLQAAYDAAANNAAIQTQGGQTFIENFVANRDNISVTIDGGYTCDYVATPSDKTMLQGAPRLSSGTVNLKNFRIVQ